MKLTTNYKILYLDSDFENFTVQNINTKRIFDIYFSNLEFDTWTEQGGYEDETTEEGFVQITTLGLWRYVESNKQPYVEVKHNVSATKEFVEMLSLRIAEQYDWNDHAERERDYALSLNTEH